MNVDLHSDASTLMEPEREALTADENPNQASTAAGVVSRSATLFSALAVVIVDDEPANQRVGKRLLRTLGVSSSNVSTLSDGT